MNAPIDIPLQILLQKAEPNKRALWFIDESFPRGDTQRISPQHAIITNRYDIFCAFQQRSIDAEFCDFLQASINQKSTDTIYYRISKEKAVTHHIINQAYQALPMDGELHLAGYKGDGIKTYLDKAKKLFGDMSQSENGAKTAKYGVLKKTSADQPLLDDKDYSTIREIFSLNDLPVVSKPGIFGWNKQDPGSEFLIEHLGEFLSTVSPPIQQVLDLGCGYGFIALQAFHSQENLKGAQFTLTDNNAAAITCAKQNCVTHNIQATVVADDCGSKITETFDIILCNPPFHKGFDVSNDITSHFLTQIKRLLKPNGKALLVVNQFVGIEKRAEKHFKQVDELARNKSFKLITLES